MACQYIEFAKESPDDFQLLYRRPMLPEQEERVPIVLEELAQSSLDNGLLRNCTARDVAYAFWSMAHGMALLALNRELHENSEDMHYQVLSQLLSSFQ